MLSLFALLLSSSFSLPLFCVGCDIVKGDHAPDGGVAQGVLHGILVRDHGRNQEEVEEELGEEGKGQEEEERSNNHVHMHG